MAIKHEAIINRGATIYNVDPRKIIVEDGWNPRTDFSGEGELKDSIIQNGVKRSLLVKKVDDRIILRNGERRLRATLKAISEGHDIKSVPCKFQDRNISDAESFFESMIADDGVRLNPVEEAEGYRKLRAWGLSVADIARRMGKSNVHIYRRLTLVDASEELKSEIRDRNITLGDAEKVIKESKGSIEGQNHKTRKVRKSNVMRAKEIRSHYKAAQAGEIDLRDDSDYLEGYMDALKKVLGES